MSRGPQTQAAFGWYVHAEDRVWGPYGGHRLIGFVAEGRVSRATMIGQSEQGPFIPAGLQGDLAHIFAQDDRGGSAVERLQTQNPARSGVSAYRDPIADLPASEPVSGSPEGRILPPAQPGASAAPSPTLSTAEGRAPVTDRPPLTGASRPLLIFAHLQSLGTIAFETVLAQHGPFERVGGGLWLIRARMGAAALRNALSRRLHKDDALLVVEADLEKAAWFNLDLAEERRVRALWAP